MAYASIVLQLAAGALAGWVLKPSLWIVAGPLRWVSFVVGMGYAESSLKEGQVGSSGETGVLQWLPATAESYGLTTASGPFDQARAVAAYVRDGLSYSARWYGVAIPFVGWGYLRTMFTHGWGDPSNDATISNAWAYFWTKGPSRTGGLISAAVHLVLLVVFVFAVWIPVYGYVARRYGWRGRVA